MEPVWIPLNHCIPESTSSSLSPDPQTLKPKPKVLNPNLLVVLMVPFNVSSVPFAIEPVVRDEVGFRLRFGEVRAGASPAV